MTAKIIYAITPQCMCKWEEKHSLCDRTSSYFEFKQHVLFLNTFFATKHLHCLSTSLLLFKSSKSSLLNKSKMSGERCQCVPPISAPQHTAPRLKDSEEKPDPLLSTFFRESLVLRERFARFLCENSGSSRGGKRVNISEPGFKFSPGSPQESDVRCQCAQIDLRFVKNS